MFFYGVIMKAWLRNIVIVFALATLLLVSACSQAPSRFEQAQKDSTGWGAKKSVVKEATQGSKFNQFFPDSVRGYQIVPAQEKKGFAEYKVNKDGKNVAVLSISDTASVPAAAAKYKNSTASIGGYPAVEQGTTGTGILVNDRYQVKILSRDPSFTKEDRTAWLQKFNLKGLAQIKSTALPSAKKVPVKANLPPKDGKITTKADLPPTERNTPIKLPSFSPQPAT